MNDLESLVTCLICSNMMCEPITMQCGHSFCRACTIKWCFEYKHYNCPTCRKKLDRPLPNVNVSLNAIVYFMQTNNIEANFNSDKNFSKLFWSLFSLSAKEPYLDHDRLMKQVTIGLAQTDQDAAEIDDDLIRPNTNYKLDSSHSHSEENPTHYSEFSSILSNSSKNDNTLSRLNIFKFPLYFLITLFGLMAIFFLRCFKKTT